MTAPRSGSRSRIPRPARMLNASRTGAALRASVAAIRAALTRDPGPSLPASISDRMNSRTRSAAGTRFTSSRGPRSSTDAVRSLMRSPLRCGADYGPHAPLPSRRRLRCQSRQPRSRSIRCVRSRPSRPAAALRSLVLNCSPGLRHFSDRHSARISSGTPAGQPARAQRTWNFTSHYQPKRPARLDGRIIFEHSTLYRGLNGRNKRRSTNMNPHHPVSADDRRGRGSGSTACSRKSVIGLALALAMLILTDAREVLAQDTVGTRNQLQEVVVTAQKRSQNAQNVGISMAVLSAKDLAAAGVQNLTDLARYTPGLGLSGAFAGQNASISIRGVTQQDFNAISEGPNSVYIDDGYLGINNIASVGLFDINRVEVLKGPQGTLFGRNATGGVLNIITNAPAATPGGYAKYAYGSYDTQRLEAAVTGPLAGDAVTGRLAILYDHNGAYVTNLAPTGGDLGGTTDWGARAKLEFKPTADLAILLTGFVNRWTSSWGPYFSLPETPVYAGSGPYLRQIDSVPAGASLLWPTNTSDPDRLTLNAHDAQSHGDHESMQGGDLHLTYDRAGWAFTSISDYKGYESALLLDDTALPVSFFDTPDYAHFTSFSEELRAYRDFHFLRLTSGLYYLNMHTKQDPGAQVVEPALG